MAETALVTNSDQSPDVFYDVAMRRLDEQLQRIDALDSKTATVFSLSSVVLPIFGGLLTLGGADVSGLPVIVLFLAALVYLFLAICSYRAYCIQDFDCRPNLDDLSQYSAAYDADTMRRWVAESCVASIDHNDPRLVTKAKHAERALKLFTILALLLAGSAIATVAA